MKAKSKRPMTAFERNERELVYVGRLVLWTLVAVCAVAVAIFVYKTS
jgi:hypothetical protein